jgi:hypothetical protein
MILTVPVAPIIAGISFVFTFYMGCIFIVRYLYFYKSLFLYSLYISIFLYVFISIVRYNYYYYYYYYYYFYNFATKIRSVSVKKD